MAVGFVGVIAFGMQMVVPVLPVLMDGLRDLVALRDGVFLRRLPWIGAIVLAGNVLRNSLLVALEARPQGLAAALHEGIGLVALALVCAAVVAVMTRGARHEARR